MYYPTTRVLTVLEMLQSNPVLTGAEIARRLEVDPRTVRRYIAELEELNIPVVADRGRDGGYRLMPGYKLPPLMLNESEALALILGLLAARRLGLMTLAPGIEGALAKVERVLPLHVLDQLRAVEETLVWDMESYEPDQGPESRVIFTLSAAAREWRQVAMQYRRPNGERSDRAFDPYGLACVRGRWYATGYCHLREDLRLFRLDRILDVKRQPESFVRPENFDVLAEVQRSLGSVPSDFPMEIVLHTSLEKARSRIRVEVAVLDECHDGTVLMRGYTENLDWLARLLAGFGCKIEIRQPVELRDALRRQAALMCAWAEGT